MGFANEMAVIEAEILAEYTMEQMEQMALSNTEKPDATGLNSMALVPLCMAALTKAQSVIRTADFVRRFETDSRYQAALTAVERDFADMRTFCWNRAHQIDSVCAAANVKLWKLEKP